MNFSPHHKPQPCLELQILTHLNPRMNLSSQEKLNYRNLTKGYIGEQKFYKLLKKELSINHILLNGLILESNNTEFQIDHLLICQNKIYLFEIKNFEGDFYVQNENWYVAVTKKEIRNPLPQLQRSEFLLRNLIQSLAPNLEVYSYIVFVNPEFMLYQAPFHQSIIFPTQINRLIKKINSEPSSLSNIHNHLARQLINKNIDQSIYERLPKYEFNQLRKGIFCNKCARLLPTYRYHKLKCENCGNEEITEDSIMRNIREFNILFPTKRITTSKIYEWCDVIPSKKTIRRILLKNLKLVHKRRHSYYLFKN